MRTATDRLTKITSSWDRRAQVKRSGLLDVRFKPELPDFLPELLPFATHPVFVGASAGDRMRLLTYGWLAFNQKAIDTERHVLVPACMHLLELAQEDDDVAAAEAVSQSLVDEAYHILLIRQATQRTLAERGLPAPRFPLSHMVQRLREHQERFPAERQCELAVLGSAIVTEVFIKGYLGQLSQAEGVQPLSLLTTRAHLADEAVHASIFLMLAKKLYRRIEPLEQEFLAEVLIRAMVWFSDAELPSWETAIRALGLPGGEEMIRDCRSSPGPEIGYQELSSFLRCVGVEDAEARIARVHAAETASPRRYPHEAR